MKEKVTYKVFSENTIDYEEESDVLRRIEEEGFEIIQVLPVYYFEYYLGQCELKSNTKFYCKKVRRIC